MCPSAEAAQILTVTDLSRGGAGVARDEQGRVVFVPYTAPGDRVRVRIVEEDKRYAQAELLEVLEPSPMRVSPPCRVFGKCGGCQWQHLPYAAQWKAKFDGVKHALARVQVESPEWLEFPAERIWEYRNRIQLRGEGESIGFFAAKSRALVPIERCEIARPEINAEIASARAEGAQWPREYKVEIEVMPDGKTRRSWNSAHAAGGFRQVHDEQNAKLQACVASFLTPGRELWDLFGGSGNLSLGLADRMKSIECVDTGVPVGARDVPVGFKFSRAKVANWVSRQKVPGAGPRSAILDPPRSGLGPDLPEILDGFERSGVTEVVAVGCDADSWARDVSRFVRRGWRVERTAVIDLFPQTPHVESLALLKR